MLDFRTDTFLTVCNTMNFTEAAKILHITQPAVSQHINYLEKAYGVSLFLYRNKQLHLTESGELLKKRLMTMKNDEKTLRDEISRTAEGIESLSMGVTMTIGEYAIVDKLAGFLHRHPEVNIHVHYGNTAQLLKFLDEGQISFALVEGNYQKEEYEHKKYSTEEYIGVCASKHQFKSRNPQKLEDLTDERLLVREVGSGTRNILEENLSARGLKIADFRHCTEIENMHTIIELLKKDCGISFMYKIAVENEIKQGILREMTFTDFKMQHDFDFIWEKGSIYSPKYNAICEELAAKNFS